MAFSSDWPQLHESGSIVSGHGLLSSQLQSLPSNPNPNHHHDGFPTRLGGSMVEKARQAKLPPPEGALKCPRCNSNNTKFCYYNNYNLTQPRHFCKACRRYWTHGGALRNVPVGGGCRRNNKKGKNGNSKSSSSSTKQASMVNAPGPSSSQLIRTNQQCQFSPNLYSFTQLGGIGLNQAQQIDSSLMNDLGFLQVGNGRNTSAPIAGNSHEIGSLNHFALFDPTTGLYAFQNEGNIGNNVGIPSSSALMVNSRVYQAAPMKMEEQNKLVNSSRPESGLTSPENQRNQYFWTGSDFSGPPINGLL